MTARPRHVLVCSGLDPSGGAGLLLDSRIVAEAGARPLGVVTAHTVQSTQGVSAAHPMDPEVLEAQLSLLLDDVEVHAAKLGMLGSQAVAEVLGAALERVAGPVVWDPVLAPSRGRIAMYAGSVEAAFAALRPSLTLLTPNAMEAGLLAGLEVRDADDALAAARRLRELGECAVLVKGGHLAEASPEVSLDLLLTLDDRVVELSGPRVAGGEHVHGTGCALASSIAAQLALGASLEEACRDAKADVARRIAAAVHPGRGAPALG
ncbi:MAG: hydroxymethylpyrimidine/phosphomethylpyrimidine kinase [Kofleriaceae bacterium]